MFRLRVSFSRGEELKFISHLDIIRLWLRAMRRAGIPLEYTEGFSRTRGFHWRCRSRSG